MSDGFFGNCRFGGWDDGFGGCLGVASFSSMWPFATLRQTMPGGAWLGVAAFSSLWLFATLRQTRLGGGLMSGQGSSLAGSFGGWPVVFSAVSCWPIVRAGGLGAAGGFGGCGSGCCGSGAAAGVAVAVTFAVAVAATPAPLRSCTPAGFFGNPICCSGGWAKRQFGLGFGLADGLGPACGFGGWAVGLPMGWSGQTPICSFGGWAGGLGPAGGFCGWAGGLGPAGGLGL